MLVKATFQAAGRLSRAHPAQEPKRGQGEGETGDDCTVQGMGERLWRSCIPAASACAVWLLLRSTEQRRGDTAQAICFLTGNLFFCGRVGHSLSLGTWQKDGGNGAEQTASLPSLSHVASSWILLRHSRNFRAGIGLVITSVSPAQ